MKQLTIIGASGHGKVVADIALKSGYDSMVFLDDDERIQTCGCYQVIGKSSLAERTGNDVFVAIGNATIRQKIHEKLEKIGITVPVLIHPNAVIAEDTVIGEGTIVMAGAVVNPGSTIGKGCIINTCSSVDHDCQIGDYVHISIGAHLAGTVILGKNTWVGAGATISNNIEITSCCMIGAGAVVINDIIEKGTYVGVPARKIDIE
ncbi:MAG: acetyltransferase [Lachnospiraceae bacterium]|nr:acetyltransferase [Lachnospiraceae bacterium]